MKYGQGVSFTGSVVKVKLMTRSVFFLPSVMHSRSHLSHQRLPKLLSLGGRRDTEGPKGGKNRSVRGNDSKRENRNSIWQDCIILDSSSRNEICLLKQEGVYGSFVLKRHLETWGWQDGGPEWVEALGTLKRKKQWMDCPGHGPFCDSSPSPSEHQLQTSLGFSDSATLWTV